MAEWRAAEPLDQKRLAATQAMGEGVRLRELRKEETHRQAVKHFEEAARLWKESGSADVNNEAYTQILLGFTLSDLGAYRKALESYEQALPLIRAVGDRSGEAATLNSIGAMWSALGERRKALEYFEQAPPLLRAVGDRRGEATTLHNVGSAWNDIGEKRKALERFEQALPLMQAVGDRHGEGTTINNIGAMWSDLGEKRKALEYYQQALTLSQAVKDRPGEAGTLANIGMAWSALGENRKALEYYERALLLSRAVEDRFGEAGMLNNIMHLLERDNPRLAILFGKQAVNHYQQLRSNIQTLDKSVQQIFLKSVENTYSFLSDRLLAAGRLAEAQQALHLAKDQEFYDQRASGMSLNTLPARALTLTPPEAEMNRRLQAALDRLTTIGSQITQFQARLGARQPTLDEAARLKQLNATLDAEIESFRKLLPELAAEINAAPEASNRLARTEDLIEMQQTLRELQHRSGTKAAAVYTLMGPDHCRTLLVTSDSIITASAPIKIADLNRKALTLLQRLQNDRYDPKVPSRELYHVIFKPIEPEVEKSGARLWNGNCD